ncbi:hypothetical protein FSP39_014862 [Pinctada imbricata]|uniref:C-type lectin domain-containing protein n=1 Tax=Pinctada imbricata TaxID=66713 RepID=A0AA89BJF6_PINIB|nr:hypothetical protein FSP39_014862 [Pinctada imbricata]
MVVLRVTLALTLGLLSPRLATTLSNIIHYSYFDDISVPSDIWEQYSHINAEFYPREKRAVNPAILDSKIFEVKTCQISRRMPGCSCDSDCMFHNNCCTYEGSRGKNRSECPTLEASYLWVIADCRSNYATANPLWDKCLLYSNGTDDPYRILPVFSRSSNKLFQNIYCAICNNVTRADDLVFPEVEVAGFNDGCHISKSRTQREFLSNILKNDKCTFRLKPSSEMVLQNCHQSLATACWQHPSDILKLIYSVNSLQSESRQFTVNGFCISCSDQKSDDMCGLHQHMPPTSEPRILIDLKLDDVIMDSTISACKSDEIFDRFSSECKRIFCGTGEIFHNDECIQMIQEVNGAVLRVGALFELTPGSADILNKTLRHILDNHILRTFDQDVYIRDADIGQPVYQYGQNELVCMVLYLTVEIVYTGMTLAVDDVIRSDMVQNFLQSEWEASNFIHFPVPNLPLFTEQAQYYTIRKITKTNPCTCGSMTMEKKCRQMPEVELLHDGLPIPPRQKVCPYLKLNMTEVSNLGLTHLISYENDGNATDVKVCLADYISFVTDSGARRVYAFEVAAIFAVQTMLLFTARNEICREFGGYLAEPSTQDIDSYIMSTTRSTNPKKIFWLGGSDLVQEGKWMWTTTNVPFSYTNWIPTDPNDGDARRHEDCLITNWSGDGKWADAGCDWKEYFLCQKE